MTTETAAPRKSIEQLRNDIAKKQTEVDTLVKEIDGMRSELAEQVRELAAAMGIPLTADGKGKKKASTMNGAKHAQEIKDWLTEQLMKGPKNEEELRTAFEKSGKGERLVLGGYLARNFLKVNKEGQYRLAKAPATEEAKK